MKLKNTTDYTDHFLRRMVAWCCKQIGYPIRDLQRCQFRNIAHHYRGFARYRHKMISVSIGPETKSQGCRASRKNGETIRLTEVPEEIRRKLLFSQDRVTIKHGSDLYESWNYKEELPNWPTPPDKRPGMQNEQFNDRTEALVAVTAHEIFHLAAHFVDQHKQRTRHADGTHGSSEQATRREEVRLLRLFRANHEALVAEWSAEPIRTAKPKPSVQEQRAAKAERQLANWQRKLKLAQTKVKQYRRKVKYYEGTLAAKSQPKEQA